MEAKDFTMAGSSTGSLAPEGTSLFGRVAAAPPDPILGLVQEFNACTLPQKQNLGPGVYMDDSGVTPLLKSVSKARDRIIPDIKTDSYLPIDGNPRFIAATRSLVFGECAPVKDGRIVGVQVPGGTGAVSLAAHLTRRAFADAEAYISDPTWPNHRGVMSEAGFVVHEYPYYNPGTRSVDFDRMMTRLRSLPRRALVVLHAGCHNPTGCDLSSEQWQILADFFERTPHIALIDAAYIGFKSSIAEDKAPITLFTERGLSFMAAVSFSKNFSLYSQRVGTLFVISQSAAESNNLLSQLKSCVRTLWSNPPSYGAALVEKVLSTPELRTEWESEVGEMRERIRNVRKELVAGLKHHGLDFSHLLNQYGMFSFTGLTSEQVTALKTKFGIFMTSNGRLSVPGLNSKNVQIVADAIAAVCKG